MRDGRPILEGNALDVTFMFLGDDGPAERAERIWRWLRQPGLGSLDLDHVLAQCEASEGRRYPGAVDDAGLGFVGFMPVGTVSALRRLVFIRAES